MKKYVRVYEESKKLLDIEKTINIAGGSIYEINIEKKLDEAAINQLVITLEEKHKELKAFIQGKQLSLPIKLINQVAKSIASIVQNIQQLNNHLTRINDLIPVIKALLKMQDRESNYENDPILIEISNALTVSIDEPNLSEIKATLEKERVELSQYDAKLYFEHLNDVSDKLIGLLNDKLLLIIGVSEFLIAGVEDDGANDIPASQRIPDELRVLFLASSTLDIISRVRQIRDGIKSIFNSIKLCLQIIGSERLESKFKAPLKSGSENVELLLSSTTPKVLQRVKKSIIELVPGLEAFELKLKLETLDLEVVIRMTYGLIYEKANRIWENPYDTQ
jgi:transcription termination factor NusB